jgi:hypothetical protein
MQGKNIRPFFLLLSFLLIASLVFSAQSADQTVTFSVSAINEISVSGNPGALVVSSANAGAQPNEVSDSSTSYLISTNGTNMKITGAIDTAMPSGVTLKLNLAAPTGGYSAGDVSMGVNSVDLVSGATKVAETGKTITYKLSATVAAGVVVNSHKTVTLTLTDGD